MNKYIYLTIIISLLGNVKGQAQQIQTKTNLHTFSLEGELNGFKADFTSTIGDDGIEYVTLKLNAAEKLAPPSVTIRWFHPVMDIQGMWTPVGIKNLKPDWGANLFVSRATTNAPIVSFHNFNNQNRLTLACSDALNSIALAAGVREETSEMDCRVKLFPEPHPLIDHYEITIRIDMRNLPYWLAIGDVVKWWEKNPMYTPNVAPGVARSPMYSTWYSFHQQLNADSIEYQCKIAKSLGCDAVIVDDGWQTLDNKRGYSFTGDWKPDRIPDMKGHVERIHKLNMKFILWYSVPFVGDKSNMYDTFKDKYLRKRGEVLVLDPRFPEVRKYIIDTYIKALQSWNLDGFKLDFVDTFVPDDKSVKDASGGRDYASVNEASDVLLTAVMKELKAIKPDIMIEFRQSYTGPLMRKYGNMFRAGDCPNDPIENRKRTIDLRLLSGATPVHADMIMWNKNEPAESAALQFLNILFSVPQISVKLNQLPASHREMIAFWLRFWNENKDVLLDGELQPLHPEMNFTQVTAINATKEVTAFYTTNNIATIRKSNGTIFLVNANLSKEITLDVLEGVGAKQIQVLDCKGKIIQDKKMSLKKGLYKMEVPPSGLVKIMSPFIISR